MISKTIKEEISAIDFSIQEFTSQARANNGMSEGQKTKREHIKTTIQCLRSIKDKLENLHSAQEANKELESALVAAYHALYL